MKKIILSFLALISLASLAKAQTFNFKKNDTISNKDERVFTPAGQTLKSKVHLVDSKHYLNIKDNHIQIVDTKTGKVSQEFDNNVIADRGNNITANTDNGWITCASWNNTGNTPISNFSTNWIVPLPPTNESSQTIFLFNGLCPPAYWTWILQPVLQWGVSGAGGGNYWAISNWYQSSGSDNYCDSLIRVSPGTILQGIMKLTRDSAGIFDYNSSFIVDSAGVKLLGCNLQVNNIGNILTKAYQALEIYGATGCADYPADTVVKMTDIQIKTGSIYPSLMWTPADFVFEYGQNTNIISNSSSNGEVDIRFHTLCAKTGINSMTTASDEIHVFPNPATNNITVENMQQVVIEISNIQGQPVIKQQLQQGKSDIDISGLAKGVYILRLYSNNRIEVTRIVKE